MKKLLLISTLMLSLLLSACGQGESVDTQATATALLESGAFSEQLEPLDESIALNLYYIDPTIVEETIVYASTGATAEEIAILTATDSAGADTLMAALEGRVESQMAVLASYQPSEMVKLEQAIFVQEGNTVILVVANDSDLAKDVLPS